MLENIFLIPINLDEDILIIIRFRKSRWNQEIVESDNENFAKEKTDKFLLKREISGETLQKHACDLKDLLHSLKNWQVV